MSPTATAAAGRPTAEAALAERNTVAPERNGESESSYASGRCRSGHEAVTLWPCPGAGVIGRECLVSRASCISFGRELVGKFLPTLPQKITVGSRDQLRSIDTCTYYRPRLTISLSMPIHLQSNRASSLAYYPDTAWLGLPDVR